MRIVVQGSTVFVMSPTNEYESADFSSNEDALAAAVLVECALAEMVTQIAVLEEDDG